MIDQRALGSPGSTQDGLKEVQVVQVQDMKASKVDSLKRMDKQTQGELDDIESG